MATWENIGKVMGNIYTDPIGMIKTVTGIGRSNQQKQIDKYKEPQAEQTAKSPVLDATTVKENITEPAQEINKAQWEREDKIRKETQEREDSAYSRAVADMRKSGINPNLVGINPAGSGGGISTASGESNTSTLISSKFNEALSLLENDLKLQESEKDRLVSIFNNLSKSIIGMFDVL